MKTLVIGCDGSGKSSFVEGINYEFGDFVLESTLSDEAKNFKSANLRAPVNEGFIDARENLFLGLSQKAMVEISSKKIENVVTTSSSLVTRVSHSVMRKIICVEADSDEAIIQKWLEEEAELPDIVVLTFAPAEVILDRIAERQERGDRGEAFWGFNSPFFLNSYQERWKKVTSHLANLSLACVEINTSRESILGSVERYGKVREYATSHKTSVR